MPEDQTAGMDPQGLQRMLGELLAANRATQANMDEIRMQFPIQPDNLANAIPDFSELEEGGLMYQGEDGPESLEPGEPGEVLEVYEEGGKKKLRWGAGAGLTMYSGYFGEAGGEAEGIVVERTATGIYKVTFPKESPRFANVFVQGASAATFANWSVKSATSMVVHVYLSTTGAKQNRALWIALFY